MDKSAGEDISPVTPKVPTSSFDRAWDLLGPQPTDGLEANGWRDDVQRAPGAAGAWGGLAGMNMPTAGPSPSPGGVPSPLPKPEVKASTAPQQAAGAGPAPGKAPGASAAPEVTKGGAANQVEASVRARTTFWGRSITLQAAFRIILGVALLALLVGGYVRLGGLEGRVANTEREIERLKTEENSIGDLARRARGHAGAAEQDAVRAWNSAEAAQSHASASLASAESAANSALSASKSADDAERYYRDGQRLLVDARSQLRQANEKMDALAKAQRPAEQSAVSEAAAPAAAPPKPANTAPATSTQAPPERKKPASYSWH